MNKGIREDQNALCYRGLAEVIGGEDKQYIIEVLALRVPYRLIY